MLILRRVRRRLLLPPGWVALGFLLLLGCQALQPWQYQLKQWNVIQLTMPALHIDKEALWNKVFYMSPAQLTAFRAWHDVDFKGQAVADSFAAATTELAIWKMMADTSHEGGARIRFLPGATYANLVKVLDIMNNTNHKKYWLDIYHKPTTLYAITDKPTHIKPVPSFTCGTRYIEVYPPPKKVNLLEVLTRFFGKLLLLMRKPWQASALLLALISSISVWQLFRPKFRHTD